ncbi:Ulp1 protease family, carboxy-terminal catalytic domain protein [Ceratobasidium sp. AG-Ba]|nr:Ulp1 protease family, carboxy-terminal catalytic domain protein [Ceratobasidium sp. AG-Ba]
MAADPIAPSMQDALRVLVLNRINLGSSLPVSSALNKFGYSPSPTNNYIELSDIPPTLFTAPSNINSSFDIWIQIPVPNILHRSAVHNAIAQASEEFPGVEISLEVTYHSGVVHLPLWIMDIWPTLGTLAFHCREWASARSDLLRIASNGLDMGLLAQEILQELEYIPLNAVVPALNPFRTSHLSELIMDTWLSDDHINAGCDFVNGHPSCPTHIRVLNSFFLAFLRRRFERSAELQHRALPLDALIADGAVRELLIPVHRPSHWALLYVDLVTWQYAYIDSMSPNVNSIPDSVINPINAWISALFNRDLALRPGVRPFPLGMQQDSHSCGVAVLSSIAYYALGGEVFQPWSQDSTKFHRLQWTLALLRPNEHHNTSNHLYYDQDESELCDIPSSEIVFDSAYTPSSCSASPTVSTLDTPTVLVCSDFGSNTAQNTVSSSNRPFTKPQLIQSKLPFKTISRAERDAQDSRRFYERQEERERVAERHKLAAEKKKLARRKQDRDRKRAERAQKKALRQRLLPKVIPDASSTQMGDKTVMARQIVASRSRPYSTAYHLDNVTEDSSETIHSGTASTRRVNWTHPLIWPQIERAALSVGYPWSPSEIVRRLQLTNPTMFASLRPQRISQWRDHRFTDVLRWTSSHMRSIQAGDRPTRTGTGRTGVLQGHPDVIYSIMKRLTDLRKAGVALDIDTIRGYMSGVIRHAIPDAFTQSDTSGRAFRCSRQFVRRFLQGNLGWSLRKATRAAQKYPPNVNSILLDAFLLFARIVRDEEIPAACIVNADQTQVVYNAGGHSTWNTSGERQVHVLGLEEKRAFTVLVAASLSGDILPFQAIYEGKTARSLPTTTARGYSEAIGLGFLLSFSGSDTYWSTQITMQHFVSRILAPYFRAQIKRNNLPPSQRCIFQIDCWSVHRSAKFRGWMAENYPWIVILYVPGGCTGLFQACDVGLQRILKLAIRHAAHNDVVNEILAALSDGTAPEDVLNDQSRPTLRDRSVDWLLRGFYAINQPEIVTKAFRLCSVPGTEFNLSYESLTSRAARQAILSLSTTDPAAYTRIMASPANSLPTHSSNPPVLQADSEAPESDFDADSWVEIESDLNHTVGEVTALVLAANTPLEAAQPLDSTPELDSDDSEDDFVYVNTHRATVSVTRAGRATRPSSRYQGQDWLTH